MWLELQIFGFRALWSPYYLIFIIGLAIAYFCITGPWREKFGGGERPTVKQQTLFYTALVLLYAVKGAPIDLLSHIMLSAHMAQMAIYYLVVPPLIIIGIPAWLWKKVIDKPLIQPVLRLLTKPIISLLLFNILFSLYHLPAIFDFSKTSQFAHSSISLILLFAAFIMWLPIIAPVKTVATIRHPLVKMVYLVGSAILITPACALIIFADVPLFDSFTGEGAWIQALSLCVPSDVLGGLSAALSGPEMFSPMGIMEDQQLGGIVMKIMQEITYGIVIGRIFFGWVRKESFKVDPLPVTEPTESHT